MSEIRCKRSARFYAEHLWLSWKWAEEKPHFPYDCQLNYIDVCVGKTVRRFENEDWSVKSEHYVTDYSISSGVKSERPWNWRHEEHTRTFNWSPSSKRATIKLQEPRNALSSTALSVAVSTWHKMSCDFRSQLAMSNRRALGILVLLVAAITGSPVEEVNHWVRYGESRLQEAFSLSRQVRTK